MNARHVPVTCDIRQGNLARCFDCIESLAADLEHGIETNGGGSEAPSPTPGKG